MGTNVDLRGQGDRLFYTQQTGFLSELFVAYVGTPPVQQFPATGNYDSIIGYLPAGSRILRCNFITGVAITGGTATLQLGNVQGGAQYVAAVAFGTPLGLVAQTIVAPSAAPYVSVDHTPVWARLVVGTAGLTALTADVILEYAHVSGPTEQF